MERGFFNPFLCSFPLICVVLHVSLDFCLCPIKTATLSLCQASSLFPFILPIFSFFLPISIVLRILSVWAATLSLLPFPFLLLLTALLSFLALPLPLLFQLFPFCSLNAASHVHSARRILVKIFTNPSTSFVQNSSDQNSLLQLSTFYLESITSKLGVME